jgi:hypothetical protein
MKDQLVSADRSPTEGKSHRSADNHGFRYDAGEGVLYRYGRPAADVVMINGKRFPASHVAWGLHYGYVPTYLKCLDGNKRNLKMSNWKERDNVWKCKRSGWWMASYKGKVVGSYYGTEQDARNAYAREVAARETSGSNGGTS